MEMRVTPAKPCNDRRIGLRSLAALSILVLPGMVLIGACTGAMPTASRTPSPRPTEESRIPVAPEVLAAQQPVASASSDASQDSVRPYPKKREREGRFEVMERHADGSRLLRGECPEGMEVLPHRFGCECFPEGKIGAVPSQASIELPGPGCDEMASGEGRHCFFSCR
jgi:hypothetical protein